MTDSPMHPDAGPPADYLEQDRTPGGRSASVPAGGNPGGNDDNKQRPSAPTTPGAAEGDDEAPPPDKGSPEA